MLFDPTNSANPVSTPADIQQPHFAVDHDGDGTGDELNCGAYRANDVMCGGNVTLPDGRVLFVSGAGRDVGGLHSSWIFDPDKIGQSGGPWLRIPDMQTDPEPPDVPQEVCRWYPTATVIGDGDILITGGRIREAFDPCDNDQSQPDLRPMRLKFPAGSAPEWELLDAAVLDVANYPFMFNLSNGQLLMAGSAEMDTPPCDNPEQSRRLDVAAELWTAQTEGYPFHGHAACMFRPDWILKIGRGANDAGNLTAKRAAVLNALDLTGAWTWLSIADMTHPRSYGMLVPLPDGNALTIGGEGSGGIASHVPELLRLVIVDGVLASSSWTEMARAPLAPELPITPAQPAPRGYHSTALLLPDARIIISGGLVDPALLPQSADIFKPPYLFTINNVDIDVAGVRPVINNVPATVQYNRNFSIQTSHATDAEMVTLVRLGASTHGFDQDTRVVPLTISQIVVQLDGVHASIRVAAPAHGHIAPPGYYMLFVLRPGDRPGVLWPSKAKIIRLTA